MASIREYRDGPERRWVICWNDFKTGRRRQVSLGSRMDAESVRRAIEVCRLRHRIGDPELAGCNGGRPGRHPAWCVKENSLITLEDACQSYVMDLTRRGRSPATLKNAKVVTQHLRQVFRDRMEQPLETLRRSDLEGFRTVLLKRGLKASTLNRMFAHVAAMLREARPDLRMPRPLPVYHIVRPIPEVDVLKTILSQLESPFREMGRLGMLTMMSLTEILSLQRADYAPAAGIILPAKPKSSQGPALVRLSAEARGIVERQLQSCTSAWLFPGPDGRPYSTDHVARLWRTAARAAGCPHVRWDDLRQWATIALCMREERVPVILAATRLRSIHKVAKWLPATVTTGELQAAVETLSTL